MQSVSIGETASQFLGKAYRGLTARGSRLAITFNNLEARMFDLRYGTDTAGKTPFQELDVTGDSVPHGTGYQAVNAGHFNAMMRALPVAAGSGFVDIGSGKGKALLLASRFPHFAHVYGVELSKALCDVANANIAAYSRRYPTQAEVRAIHTDGAAYEIPPEINVVFLNNPFDAVLMLRFVENMRRSLEIAPRALWLVYGNPANAGVVEGSGLFDMVRHHRFLGPGRDMRVYLSRPRG